MSLQDTDAFIVSDTAGTNYQVAASDMANYANSKATGGGGGGSQPNAWAWLVGRNGLSIIGPYKPKFYNQLEISVSMQDATVIGGGQFDATGKQMFWAANPWSVSITDSSGGMRSGPYYIAFPEGMVDTFEYDFHCNWSISYVYGQYSKTMVDLYLYGNTFYVGVNSSFHFPKLQNINGDGNVIGTVTRLASLKSVNPNIRFTIEPGDLDFSETAFTAEAIEAWLTGDYLNKETNSLGGYFKTIRLEGGTVAAYEDLSTVAKEAITTLQGRGYTIVMNGTGDSTTVNVSAGNAGLIITTSDGKYVPVKASTSDAIFPPTGYTNITEFATLGDILTAIKVNLPDFDGTRLFGKLFDEDEGTLGESLSQALGTSVTFDATPESTIPAGTTISYQWYKNVDDNPDGVLIPNATSATLTTSSLTADQLGSYFCILECENSSTSRSIDIKKTFSISEPLAAVPNSELMGAS